MNMKRTKRTKDGWRENNDKYTYKHISSPVGLRAAMTDVLVRLIIWPIFRILRNNVPVQV